MASLGGTFALSPSGTFEELNARGREARLRELRRDLFPGMPRVNLRQVWPIVKPYRASHGIPYKEVTVWASHAALTQFFGKVNRRAHMKAGI